jgi:XRE family transcriptional regulator, regulator of sulfur utilization
MNKPSLVVVAFVSGAAVAAGGAPTPPILGSTAVSWEEIEATPSKGIGKQVFRSPTATLDELELHVSRLPPGKAAHAPHKHPDEELIIVREGTVESLVNGKTRRLGPGSVIFQASNQLHGIRNVGDVPAVYHVIKWNSPGMLKARSVQR